MHVHPGSPFPVNWKLKSLELIEMIAMPCPTSDALRALTTGQLNDSQSGEIVEHIRQCDVCREDLAKFDDREDSLIALLRQPDEQSALDREPNCRMAVAKALGALATAGNAESDRPSPAAGPVAELPRTIGEYEIVGPLGSGGMGSVFLAQHTKLGRRVAVKVLANHRLADPRMRRRFEAEMRAVGRLSHPNIVTAHDARDVDGMAVLVTEYIDGLDLGQLVRRTGPLGSEPQGITNACEIVRQVALALAYTSDQGFVHRDVKPSNIMLSSNGEVKLLDLGLARFQSSGEEPSEMTGTGQYMGTADYMAPEQVGDSRAVDVRADIYSLGCTLFKLLTGAAPFADETHGTVFAKMTAHVATPPPVLAERLGDVPPELSKLVDRMLAKSPDQRPATPSQVADILAPLTSGSDLKGLAERAAVLESRPMEKRTSSTPVRERRTSPTSFLRRSVPLPIAIATGLLGLLLGFLLGILITVTRPDGSRITMTVPDGSDIDIRGSDDSEPEKAAADATATTSSGEIQPLVFAVLVEPDEVDPERLARARKALEESDQEGPVATELGTWFSAAPEVQVSIEHEHGGRRFALARHDAGGFIGWEEIRPGTGVMISAGEGIQFSFASPMATRMRQISSLNRRRQLSMIVRGTIRSAPVILDEFSDSAVMSGRFTSEDMEFLLGAFAGLLNEPSASAGRTGAGGIDASNSWNLTQALRAHEASQESLRPLETSRAATPVVDSARAPGQQSADTSRRTSTRDNFTQMGVAFHNFHDVYQKFPGSANVREGGRGGRPEFPFSWRVAILPFIEQQGLFEEYRFDEPWNSPANLALLPKMPDVYRSPLADAEGLEVPVGHTNYLGLVGETTALGPSDGQPVSSFTDGTSNTILVVESTESRPWTAPEDIPFAGREDARNVKPFAEMPLQFLAADGAVHSMDHPIDYERLGKLITRNGGEPVRLNEPSASSDRPGVGGIDESFLAQLLEAISGLGANRGTTGDVDSERGPAQQPADTTRRASTRDNFTQIGVAFHNFHDVFQKFPGSANVREGGRGAPEFPFSWRVAILPFIEQNQLFEEYRFDEPWNSPANLALLPKMPDVYRSPLADAEGAEAPVGYTNYLGLVGETTALGPNDGQPIRSFTDGTSNTILVVESTESRPWTAPEDIPFAGLEDARNVKPFAEMPLQFLAADGSVHSMNHPIDYERLGKLITRNGGEAVRP